VQEVGWPRVVAPDVLAATSLELRTVREAIHTLKYNGVSGLAELLVERCWSEQLEEALRGQPLVPVPTSRSRFKQRGYNQAELIAQALARRSDGEVQLLLEKRGVGTQVGHDREEREAAARVAYGLRKGVTVPAGVILIDDVFTTGATIEACRRALGVPCPAFVVAAAGR
jgi:predicted amidophosphoribosyltransferase